MKRLLRVLPIVLAALGAAAPARAVWARSSIAEFPHGGGTAKIVRLGDGPALVVFEQPTTLTILRRRDGDWTRVGVPLPYEAATDVEACACRGDGIVRLYVVYSGDPRVTEITPGADGWRMSEFNPSGESPGPRSMTAVSDGLAWATSRVDGRPVLYVRHRRMSRIFECRWKDAWNCAPGPATAGFGDFGVLRANPPGWSDKDVLLDQTLLDVREASGWRKVIDFRSIGVLPSAAAPRRVYVFALTNNQFDLDAALLPNRGATMPSDQWETSPGPLTPGMKPGDVITQKPQIFHVFQAAGTPRGGGVESLFGEEQDGQLHEAFWASGRWKDAPLTAYSGFSGEPVVGDLRGDGVERVYALSYQRNAAGAPASLWEFSFYPRRSVVLVRNPAAAALDAEQNRLLGEMIRAEMGRHGNLDVVDRRSRAAADAERALTGDAGGDAAPDASARFRVDPAPGGFALSVHVTTTRPPTQSDLRGPVVAREDLPQAALALARRVAEEWPREEGAAEEATPASAAATEIPAAAAAETPDAACTVLTTRYDALGSDPKFASAVDTAFNSRSRAQRTSASLAALGFLGFPTNAESLARSRALTSAALPWCRYWGVQLISFLELADVRDANAKNDVLRGLQDADAQTRRAAVEALGVYPDENFLPPLYHAFKTDPDPQVRFSAAYSLSASGLYSRDQRRRMLPIFLSVLKDPGQDANTRELARHAMSDITGQNFGMDAAGWERWIAANR